MLSLRPTLFALALTGACVAQDEATEETVVANDLELENGGLDTTDEAPMFGDAALFARADLETDRPYVDALASDAGVRAIAERPDAISHRIAILWGQLPPDRRPERAKEWSGVLSLSGGAMVVRRTIGFEDRDDIIEGRTDRTQVAFRSMTKPFSDGLVLEVFDDRATPSLGLSYRGAAGEFRIDLDALASGPVVIDVDAEGNKLVATALRRTMADDAADPCNRGFMRGRWHQLRPHLGVYVGGVANADGDLIGHVRGIYGERRNGEQVFFGKFINRDGAFTGIMAGHYRDGEFAGRWITRAGDAGRVHGMYRDGSRDGVLGGGWVARYAETRCAADLANDMP